MSPTKQIKSQGTSGKEPKLHQVTEWRRKKNMAYNVYRAPSGSWYGLKTQYIRVSSAHKDYIDTFGYKFNKHYSCLEKYDVNQWESINVSPKLHIVELNSTEKTEARFLHFLSDVWATAQAQTECDNSLTVENILVAVPRQIWIT